MTTESTPEAVPTTPTDFIREIIDGDLASGKHSRVVTRFPPEPNGYLHIGHAKSICLNFGLARQYGGVCHLRFDDTNPSKEDEEYVRSIQEDVRWLGFDWADKLFHASDYFEKLYQIAESMVLRGLAYVDDQTAEQIRVTRGTPTEHGKESPFRNRSAQENLDLLRRMRAGEFAEGTRVLRAKIDMASPNIVMRDPPMYRIRKVDHQRTGSTWCIYPMYDFAHGLSDSFEGITHSICTLEFANNRPLYDWFVANAGVPCQPQQTEFARLNLTYTVMSKRKLLQLVADHHVAGWDDPRMPTIAGMRRRGYSAEAIREFCTRIGVGKRPNWIELSVLEDCVRDDQNPTAPRVMAVLRPLKIVIENYPEGQVEEIEAPFHPDDPPRLGSRRLPFSREIYVDRDDFMEDPPKKFFRLGPGREVRLRWTYFITCTGVVKDPVTGEVTELRATYDPTTQGGQAADNRRPKGTIHWVSAAQSVPAEVRLYDRLFRNEKPGEGDSEFLTDINPDSLTVCAGARVEPSLATAAAGSRFQFERQGYFIADAVDTRPGHLVFNRTVSLKDSWAKIVKKG